MTFGPQVARINSLLGRTPDENQQEILDTVFAERNGVTAAETAVVIAARQNLKTIAMEMCGIGWLLVTEPGPVLWTAQRFKTARESFEKIAGLLDREAWSRRRVEQIVSSNGRESIRMRSGMRMDFGVRNKDAGRGMKYARLVLDEGYSIQPSHMGALLPLLSTYADRQTLIGSSASRPESSELRRWRDIGRAGAGVRRAYFEWADDPTQGPPCELGPECMHLVGSPGCRLDDPERIRRANPSVGSWLEWDAIWQERANLSPGEFARERLGWHDEPSEDSADALPADAWAEAEDEYSETTDDYVFGLSVAPSRSFAAIGVAGRNREGRLHLEVTSDGAGLVDYRPGVSWVMPVLRELAEAHPGARLAVLRGSAAESLVPAIERIVGLNVELIAAAAYPQACGFLSDAADARTVAHLGQMELSAAVESAVRRPVGDRTFQWGRKRSGGDITPLVAVTLAAWLMAPTDQAYDPVAGIY